MENNPQIEKVFIKWEGPYNEDEIISGNGLYQIYGTHPIYGRNVLLYIGQTKDSFETRFKNHRTWLQYEFDPVKIYFGKILNNLDSINEKCFLDEAEKILIYYCAPAYNSYNIGDLSRNEKNKELIIFNCGKIGSIPTEVSSIWYNAKDIWEQVKEEHNKFLKSSSPSKREV